jgi:4'-phosphopantetheinyl transferase
VKINWPLLADVPELAGTDVHIWAFPLRVSPSRLDALRALLTVEEIARADRIIVPVKRDQSAISRGVARTLLGAYTGIPAADLRFRYGDKGRPYLDGPGEELVFNVTHSGELGAIALTREGELGVDVEEMDGTIDLIGIGRRFFSTIEHADLSSQRGAARTRAFFRAWTRKESYLKARGAGLSLPLDGFDVTLLPGQEPRLLATRFDPGDAARWTLTELEPCDGYAGALCADQGERALQTFCWTP